MKWCKGISNQILGISTLLGTSNILAANDWSHTQTLGEPETYDLLKLTGRGDSGLFSDPGTFTLDSCAGSANVSIVDRQLTQDYPDGVAYSLHVSDFEIKNSDDNTLYLIEVSGDFIDDALSIQGQIAGSYGLTFGGLAEGGRSGVYNVTVSEVPLPAAAWLFGIALAGFVVFSARRSV